MATYPYRLDPVGRMTIRALSLHDGRPQLNARDIASLTGKSVTHAMTVLAPVKALRGKSPAKIADVIFRLYATEAGPLSLPREAWNDLWLKVQAGAAADVARLAGLISQIAKIADGRTWVLKLGRRQIRKISTTWYEDAPEAMQADAREALL